MRTAALPLFALALALVLAACGEVRWHKPGSDDASLANDFAACRAAAHDSIQRMYGPPQPQMGGGVLGAAPVEPSLADRQMREQQAVGRCMREKGYSLEPVER
jgi:hypothetical protein